MRLCDQVDGVIAPGTALVHELRGLGVRAPITVLPSPVRENFFAPPVRPERAVSESKGKLRLLCVARFEQEKNLEQLLTAHARLAPACQLTLVGHGTQEQLLRKQANKQVQFLVQPTAAQLLAAYAHADAFIFTSQSETQGLVLAEAMAQGLPVLALAGPGIDDIVIDGVNGFACATPQELGARVVQLAESPKLRARLAAGAWETAQKYRPALFAQRLLELYGLRSHPFDSLTAPSGRAGGHKSAHPECRR
jgi:glycosyltransferase involved in cell wall biosynthesis